jgi:hypothetical protein
MAPERLSPERRQNAHNFSFEGDVCTWCGMSLEHYQDRGKPRCRGIPTAPTEPRKQRSRPSGRP